VTDTTRALVLGGGGVAGTAWMAGLASGLRRAGVDLAGADLIVGTSAGAIVGTMLATGQDLGLPGGPARPAGQGGSAPTADPGRLAEVFAILGDASLQPAEARRRVGRLALTAKTITEQAHIAMISALITAREWPDRELLITAADVETGELKVWGRAGIAPLPAAVASSCAMPGASPPVTISGRQYMDGGIVSATNADVATGADVLVLVEPLAHLFPREPLQRELAAAGAGTVITISPDQAAVDAFGPDLGDWAAWQPARQAGIRQATITSERLRAAWLRRTS
jgi:NTE family protein